MRVVVFVVILLCVACAVPLMHNEPDVIVLSRQALAQTVCINHFPVTVIREEVIGSPSEAEIQAHEAEHRRQFLRDCDGLYAKYQSDPHTMLRIEAQAYCVGIRAGVPHEIRRDYLKSLADFFIRAMSRTLSEREIRQVFAGCDLQ